MDHSLVIIFNQDYSRNIEKLEYLYGHRFTNRIYLVPYHHSVLDVAYRNGKIPIYLLRILDRTILLGRKLFRKRSTHTISSKERVRYRNKIVWVGGSQIYFQDFVVQAAQRLLSLKTEWYWFIGDDAILNPKIAEESVGNWFPLSHHDAILCTPIKGTDEWIARISGSPDILLSNLERAAAKPGDAIRRRIPKEDSRQRNDDAIVACCDFFGVRYDLLERLIRPLAGCTRHRVYVEAAIPNAILSYARSPCFFSNFYWTRNSGNWMEVADIFQRRPNTVFAHPIKLSGLDIVDIRTTLL